MHFYLHFEFTVISDYDRSRINIFNNKNVTKSTNHELVLDSDNQLLFMLPSEMDGHGHDFGHEYESVSEADSDTRFFVASDTDSDMDKFITSDMRVRPSLVDILKRKISVLNSAEKANFRVGFFAYCFFRLNFKGGPWSPYVISYHTKSDSS